MHNLEPLAAQESEAVLQKPGLNPKDVDRIATRALHVLGEQGVFAFGLFLATRKREQDKEPAEAIHDAVRRLLHRLELISEAECERNWIGFYRSLTEIRQGEASAAALHRLLLIREAIELLLLYTRYAAKANQAG